MKKIKFMAAMISMIGLLSLSAAPTVSAFELFGEACEGNSDSSVCQDAGQNQTLSNNSVFGPDGILTLIINILSIIIGVAAVVMIIVAGIQYMLSTGDPTKTNNAKNAILYAVAGLVIAAFAQAIVRFILSRL